MEQGETEPLVELLASDATMYGDGGGRAPARRDPVAGAAAITRFLVNLAMRARIDGVVLTLVDVNGQPGAIAQDPSGQTVAVMSLDIVDERVHTIRSVVNPDKLLHLT